MQFAPIRVTIQAPQEPVGVFGSRAQMAVVTRLAAAREENDAHHDTVVRSGGHITLPPVAR